MPEAQHTFVPHGQHHMSQSCARCGRTKDHQIHKPLVRLRDIAPRLALARDQALNEILVRRHVERRLSDERLRAERLVAHRELQLIRAGARPGSHGHGHARYLGIRQRKLDQARGVLERVVKAQERLS